MGVTMKALAKGALKGCGIGTVVINAIILFFTLPKAAMIDSGALLFNFMGVAVGCGLLCPLFGGMVLKDVTKAHPTLDYGDKSAHAVARFVPNNLFLAAVVIGVLTTLVWWVLPCAVAMVASINVALPRLAWLIIIALYSGACASFAAYFGMLRSHYVA